MGLLLLALPLLRLQGSGAQFDLNPTMHTSDEFEGGMKVGDTIGGAARVGALPRLPLSSSWMRYPETPSTCGRCLRGV